MEELQNQPIEEQISLTTEQQADNRKCERKHCAQDSFHSHQYILLREDKITVIPILHEKSGFVHLIMCRE